MPNVRIRPIEGHDVGAWAAMRSQLWPDAKKDELAREAVAFVEGSATIVDAAMTAQEESSPIGFEESARGRGVGRALMHAAEDWARGRGFTELASDSELHNLGAQGAHKHCGFDEVDRIVKFRKRLD